MLPRAPPRAARDGCTSTSGEALQLPSTAHRRAALARGEPAAATSALAARAAAVLPRDDVRRADALEAAGRTGEAAAALRDAASAARSSDALARAALLYQRAAGLVPGVLELPERMALVTGLGLLGRYDDAAAELAAADAAGRRCGGARRHTPSARRGCARGAGDLEGARRTLEQALATATDGAGAELRARLGRLLVTMGRYSEALAVVEPTTPQTQAAPLRAVSLETAVLALAYIGDAERARQRLADLDARWRWRVMGGVPT